MSEVDAPSVAARSSHWPAIPPPLAVPLTVLPEHSCPYLPGRMARSRAIWTEQLPAGAYHEWMNSSFRRSGKVIYQPICAGCRACMPIRVPIASFQASKSQRRCLRRNSDLLMTVDRPAPTREKHELYLRYMREWHGATTDDNYEQFASFLYDSPVETLEFCHRLPDGRLLAVGICDLAPMSLSSVYFYFDPREAHRGLGTQGVLREIEFARRREVAYYYLGYWIDGCRSMQYKSAFRPCQILWPDGVWRAGPAVEPLSSRRI